MLNETLYAEDPSRVMNKFSSVYSLIKLNLVECGIGLLLHGLGMFAIISSSKKTNQILILFSLSVVETLLILCRVIGNILDFLHFKSLWGEGYDWDQILWNVWRMAYFAQYVFIIELLFVMHMLTADRLGGVTSPIKYIIYMSRC